VSFKNLHTASYKEGERCYCN